MKIIIVKNICTGPGRCYPLRYIYNTLTPAGITKLSLLATSAVLVLSVTIGTAGLACSGLLWS